MFAFTLDKSEGNFSPTARYRDDALNPGLIHWETQSPTSVSLSISGGDRPRGRDCP
ncbi:MAG: hypothetical protein WCJ67_07480 [Thermoleophilia bacterium]